MTKEKGKEQRTYQVELTERQVKILSYACDQFARCIQGQDGAFQELFEAAWEKRCKEAVGGHGMDKEWDGGWYNMRHEAESLCKWIKRRFWGRESNSMYGIHYDDTADILIDIHFVLRHQLWLDRPDGEKSRWTVDAESPTSPVGDEPLAIIRRKER